MRAVRDGKDFTRSGSFSVRNTGLKTAAPIALEALNYGGVSMCIYFHISDHGLK